MTCFKSLPLAANEGEISATSERYPAKRFCKFSIRPQAYQLSEHGKFSFPNARMKVVTSSVFTTITGFT